MFKVQVIGRADHDKVIGPRRQQSLGIRQVPTSLDPGLGQYGCPHGCRVSMGNHLKVPADLFHGSQDVGNALAKADDANAVGFHGSGSFYKAAVVVPQ